MTQFLGANLALGLVLCGVLLLLAARLRHDLRTVGRVPELAWRWLAWTALGTTVALVSWGTLADNWRKLIGEALDLSERFASQRIVREPVATEIRAVTLVLLAASLLTVAPLCARYVGGYLFQFVLIVTSVTAFFPLYALRQRLDMSLVTLDALPPLFSLAMLATIVFVALAFAANVTLLLLTYLGLLGLIALPVTLLLDLLGRREPPASETSAAFYTTLQESRAAHRRLTPQPVGEESRRVAASQEQHWVAHDEAGEVAQPGPDQPQPFSGRADR